MSWTAVVAALDDSRPLLSRLTVYQHPLGGRSIVWHVLRALMDVQPQPDRVRVLHCPDAMLGLTDLPMPVDAISCASVDGMRTLRAAITAPGMTLLVDGAAPLLSPSTLSRLLRGAEQGVVALPEEHEQSARLAVAGEGPALASAEDPRRPVGATRVTPLEASEMLRVVDRHTLSLAGVALRDRLVREHEDRGVSFLLPATTWLDVDVRIGGDTVIYPGCVLEGATEIEGECVIGPGCRIVEANIGRGAELKGWNYVTRTRLRNHAVLEPHERRGMD